MKLLLIWLKAALVPTLAISTSVAAAPIFSAAEASSVSDSLSEAASFSASSTPLFSHMGLNGGLSHSVVFLGDDNSVLIGHYARGPWSKQQFLQSWQNGDDGPTTGGEGSLPPSVAVTSVPEPATFALFVLGLLALTVVGRPDSSR